MMETDMQINRVRIYQMTVPIHMVPRHQGLWGAWIQTETVGRMRMMSSPWRRHNGLTLITTDTEITKQVRNPINALLSKVFPDTIGWDVPMRTKMATPILH